MGKGMLFSVILLLCFPISVLPEGTRQIAPFSAAAGQLCIDKSRNDFGFFDAAPEFRINIYIADLGEKINFGLGAINFIDTSDVKYRIKDPSGNIVMGPNPVPLSGQQGFISTYDQAIAGPLPLSGGYDPIQYTPVTTGNYIIEFSYPPDSLGRYSENARIMFEFFDISVVDNTGKQLTGRVWSKAWQFNCGNVQAPPTDNRFWGTMFILSDDSIVTSVNCNGFVGGTFSISSNKTGCSTTGNIASDRQSRTGFHTYPQYKVFLADPDSLIFPTGKAQPGIIMPITTTTDCATGSVDFGVKVDQDGIVELLVEVNPNPGTDPQDVKLTANVYANPGGNGFNIIHWSGKDGRGNPVHNGKVLSASVRFIHGITHLPIYDIEYNDNGYIVKVIRPPGPSPSIYWDDSLLPVWGTVNLTGCTDIYGCHLWSIEIGDTNTINSWWYVASATAPTVSFTVKRAPLAPGTISGDPTICKGISISEYHVVPDSNATSYIWSYTGAGASVTPNGASVSLGFADTASSGTLTVRGFNTACGAGPASFLPVTVLPLPVVIVGAFDSICYNAPPIHLSGGSPAGGEYILEGSKLSELDPATHSPGIHGIIYRYTDVNGCTGSDTSAIFIKSGNECEIVIWVPNAFTPDGDGVNDVFRPYSLNVRQFSMKIFNRMGQLLFSSGEISEGWDGTWGGQQCPQGNYAYLIVYESSANPPEFKTLSGIITLVK
ncbi:MAG: gliding motility-associated C-terminal domain-containing protein [Bacteroidota bacterium]